MDKFIISSTKEKRYIRKVSTTPQLLKKYLKEISSRGQSYNLMVITKDWKVVLLERTASFIYPFLIKEPPEADLSARIGFNRPSGPLTRSVERPSLFTTSNPFIPDGTGAVDLKGFNTSLRLMELCELLYPTELQELGIVTKTSFRCDRGLDPIYIFPGGHSNKNERVIYTLLRELYEETSIRFSLRDLKFCQVCFFEVIIDDLTIQKIFKNVVFPVKVDLSSQEIALQFKETKHTRNPTFIDIFYCRTLSEALIHIQKIMLLK